MKQSHSLRYCQICSNLFMQKFNFPAPGESLLSIENQQLLIDNFYTDGLFDRRRWRNKNNENVKPILDAIYGSSVAEKVFTGVHGQSFCNTCGGNVNLGSSIVGWKRFCCLSCAQKHPSTRQAAEETCLRNNGGKNIWEIPGNKAKISAKISNTKRQKLKLSIEKLQKSSSITVEEDASGMWRWAHTCGEVWFTNVVRQKMRCPKCASSRPEEELIEFIKSVSQSAVIKRRDRRTLYPKEIDILVNETFGIEYNGAYWHRDAHPKASQEKVVNAAASNIRLMTVLESDWVHKREKVCSKIRSYISPLTKVGARTLTASLINKDEAQNFLSEHHFNGATTAKMFCGLRDRAGQLLLVATFSPTRLSRKTDEWELVRLCTRSDLVVTGGVSKIISFWKKLYPNIDLISYHDLKFGWSDGLINAGFKLVGTTKPGWRWVKGKAFLERWSTQKHKISNIIADADLSKTEVEIMCGAGWIQEFNPGNSKWLLPC